MFPASAPPPGTVLCALADVPEGATKGFRFGAGAEDFRHVHRVLGRGAARLPQRLPAPVVCRSIGSPGRFLTPDGTYILCANHAAVFRIDDGACLGGPCHGAGLVAVNLEVSNGEIVMGRRGRQRRRGRAARAALAVLRVAVMLG